MKAMLGLLQEAAFPVQAGPPTASFTTLVIPFVFGVVGLAICAMCAVRTWRRGHTALFAVGFVVPLAWIAGAFLPPAPTRSTVP